MTPLRRSARTPPASSNRPPFAKDALLESVDAGIRLSVIVTEHIPFHDMLVMYHYARRKGARIIGPNCPGIASPGRAKVGIIPNVVFRPVGWGSSPGSAP